MSVKPEIYLTLKFLRFRRGSFFTLLNLVSVISIFLGVSALIITLAIINGFHTEIKHRILSITPHMTLKKFFNKPFDQKEVDSLKNILQKYSDILSVSSFVSSKSAVRFDNKVEGVMTYGVDFKKWVNFEEFKSHIILGDTSEFREGGVYIGVGLANKLGVGVGDTIVLYDVMGAELTPLGLMVNEKRLKIAGIYDVGLYDLNSYFVFLNIQDLQEIMNYKFKFTGLEIKLKDPFDAQKICKKLSKRIKFPYYFITWIDLNKNFFSALKLEKIALGFVLMLIIVVAGFNIASNLFTSVYKNKREIGVLRSIGFTTSDILKIFLYRGMFIGILGIISGSIFGVLVSYILDKYKVLRLPPDVYVIYWIPLKISFLDLLWVVLGAFLIVLFSSYYPAKKASQILPAEAVRYE